MSQRVYYAHALGNGSNRSKQLSGGIVRSLG